MKCARCGAAKASYRWELKACADGRKKRSRYLCQEHDIELNAMVMTFLSISGAEEKLDAYRAALSPKEQV